MQLTNELLAFPCAELCQVYIVSSRSLALKEPKKGQRL